MSITVLAPAYYTSMYPVRYLAESAKRYGIDVKWYGLGKPYPGWYDVQIIDLLEELAHVTTSHVLYTDASDAIFLTNLDEIWWKYIACAKGPRVFSQMVVSKEQSGICAGGWISSREEAIYTLDFLRSHKPQNVEDSDNPQVRWRTNVTKQFLAVGIDYSRDIFQVVDEPLDIVDGRVFNPRLDTYPCILHFAGGYTDPTNGKAALIEPYWKQLGY